MIETRQTSINYSVLVKRKLNFWMTCSSSGSEKSTLVLLVSGFTATGVVSAIWSSGELAVKERLVGIWSLSDLVIASMQNVIIYE